MAAYDYAKLSVLLVEDEAHTRQLVRRLLLQLGVRTIFEAVDGKDGLLQLLRIRPDIVFCDVHMKPVNGLEMLAQLRAVKLPDLAGTPVVMLTGDAAKDTVMFARNHAVNGYLVKPIAPAALKARIDVVVAGNAGLARSLTLNR
ncbi:MAG: response regulator [Azospirillum sp.]|nr:response regulator [Azospirillum sp.]